MHKLEGNHATFKFMLVMFTSEMPYINNSFRRDMVQTFKCVSFQRNKNNKIEIHYSGCEIMLNQNIMKVTHVVCIPIVL